MKNVFSLRSLECFYKETNAPLFENVYNVFVKKSQNISVNLKVKRTEKQIFVLSFVLQIFTKVNNTCL